MPLLRQLSGNGQALGRLFTSPQPVIYRPAKCNELCGGLGFGGRRRRQPNSRSEMMNSITIGMITADVCAAAAMTSHTSAIGSSGMNGGR